MFELGRRLRRLRLEKEISMIKVARALGISISSISSYENATKCPSLEVLIGLAEFYNVSTDYLLGLDDRQFINIDGINDIQKGLIKGLINEFRRSNK